MLQVSEYNDFTLKKDGRIWRLPQEEQAFLDLWVRVPEEHCTIFKGHRLLPATNLIYVTFICLDLVNCSGQVPTINVLRRSVKPQSIEKMNIFFESSGWVQEQLGQAVRIREGKLVSFWRSKLARPRGASPELALRMHLSMLVAMDLSCLFRKARNAGLASLH